MAASEFSMLSGSSGSSSASYASSALGRMPSAPSHSQSTDTSTCSAVSDSAFKILPPSSSPLPIDLGPPGYQATITLFERTSHELTVYLGPWEVVESHSRRVVWQCSYQGEILEHFLPMSLSSQVQPVTLHGQHRPYSDPAESELFVTFREPHRVRYTKADGTVVHDEVIDVQYEFTSLDGSMGFQGDFRRQDLIDYFDVDVVFSDTHSRRDSFTGTVRGLATIQRIKLWKDRHSGYHCISFFSDKPSNRRDRRYREYFVTDFQEDFRGRDDKHRECRLGAIGRRGSAPNTVRAKSFHITSPSSWTRQRLRSVGSNSDIPQVVPLDVRWLGIRFSRDADYRRFMARWAECHSTDRALLGVVPLPSNHANLTSPAIEVKEFEIGIRESYEGHRAP